MNNLKKFFCNKKILITGHTGFKGTWLAKVLLNCGANVAGVALEPNITPSLFVALNIKENIKNYFEDIRNFEKLKEIILQEKPEIVFHLAAQAIVRNSYDNPFFTFYTNTMGTTNLLQAIKEAGFIKSTVIITSDKVYKDKKDSHLYKESDSLGGYDPYSSSKAAADIITNAYIQSFFNPKDFNNSHQTLIAIARAGNVLGGGDWGSDRLVPDVVRAIYERNEKIIIRNPNSIRAWIHIFDILNGYLSLAKELYNQNRKAVGAWNFGPNEEGFRSVEDLTKMAISILSKGGYEIKSDKTKHETDVLKLDVSKAKKILNWSPKFNFKMMLEFTFKWYKNYYQNKKAINKLTNRQIELFFGL